MTEAQLKAKAEAKAKAKAKAEAEAKAKMKIFKVDEETIIEFKVEKKTVAELKATHNIFHNHSDKNSANSKEIKALLEEIKTAIGDE